MVGAGQQRMAALNPSVTDEHPCNGVRPSTKVSAIGNPRPEENSMNGPIRQPLHQNPNPLSPDFVHCWPARVQPPSGSYSSSSKEHPKSSDKPLDVPGRACR